jgi:hypothetical protein
MIGRAFAVHAPGNHRPVSDDPIVRLSAVLIDPAKLAESAITAALLHHAPGHNPVSRPET